ncbi:hypothetical protein B0187_04765 [Haemophilus paracuniculus]|uniref:Uncharacterized protein n=1 Tax=Haemophilus paracuniculus TaxID=734 RepID=A0A1T0ASK6_9PAST|nr:hypothetical protein [Haemophilus paracuniculus]OOR99408.1 hypothetical protein B0187_04765 [Haemophilus paracuniculus]
MQDPILDEINRLDEIAKKKPEDLTAEEFELLKKGSAAYLHSLQNMDEKTLAENIVKMTDNHQKIANVDDIRFCLKGLKDNISMCIEEKNTLIGYVVDVAELQGKDKEVFYNANNAIDTAIKEVLNMFSQAIEIHSLNIYRQLQVDQIVKGKLNSRLRNNERAYKSQVAEIAKAEWGNNLATTYSTILKKAREKYNITETDDTIKKYLSEIDPLPKNQKRTKNGKIVNIKT